MSKRLGSAAVAALAVLLLTLTASGVARRQERVERERGRAVAHGWTALHEQLLQRSGLVPHLLRETGGAERIRLSTLVALSRAHQRVRAQQPALHAPEDLAAYAAAQRELGHALAALRAEAREDAVLRRRARFQALLAELAIAEREIRRQEQEYHRVVREVERARRDHARGGAAPPPDARAPGAALLLFLAH